MEIQTRIAKLKDEKMSQIQDAAKCGDTSTVVSISRTVETIEKLQKKLDEILIALATLERVGNKQESSLIDLGISYKGKGRIRRAEFVEALKGRGVEATQIKGVLWEIGENKVVGIAYASERSHNKWFLGLPRKDYHAVILLCEDEYGSVINFIFPEEFYQTYEHDFSEDQNGQLKFNITLSNGGYKMKIPRKEDVYINAYIDSFGNL